MPLRGVRLGMSVAVGEGMRFMVLAVAVLGCVSAAHATGTILVRLDGGDTLAVEAYRVEADGVRLTRGGVEVTVPRATVREVQHLGVPFRPPAAIGVRQLVPPAGRAAPVARAIERVD
jgi:hypothetical protein